MFFNVTPDRCAKETICQNCSSRTMCLSPTHRIGRFPLKEGAQNVLTAVRTNTNALDSLTSDFKRPEAALTPPTPGEPVPSVLPSATGA
jgi:hypothetical protein